MRKLNVPVQDIKDYLQNRNVDKFEQILLAKEKECDKIIENTLNIKKSLHLSLQTLEKIRKTRFNQIQINFQKEKTLFVSETLTETMSLRERFRLLSKHNQAAFAKEHFKEITTGWIIDKDEFLAKRFNKTIQYFTPVSHTVPEKHRFVRPEGLYLTVRFQGTYYQQVASVYKEILDFVQRNTLQIVSNVYVFPLKNHWLTTDTTTYINQISFQVEYSSC